MIFDKFDERIPLFDGEADHRIPCTDITLLRSRIFILVGKLMAYLAIHSGYAFLGLSPAVVKYITTPKSELETVEIEIVGEDIPDYDLRQEIDLVSHCDFLCLKGR